MTLICRTPNHDNPLILLIMVKTFEDIENFLDKSVVIPDKDVAIPHISADGDALMFRRGGLFIGGHLGLGGSSPLSAYYTV